MGSRRSVRALPRDGRLYPSFADRPSQALELQLLGLLQAVRHDGYPIKVALVGGKDDLTDAPGMLRHPQRYADQVVAGLESVRPVTAPLLVVTPHGLGIAGARWRTTSTDP